MGKITEIKFVGQPIFKQIMNLMEKVDINGLISKQGVITITSHSDPPSAVE